MELEMKDIQAVVVLPFTRTEFRRMLWIPERCFPGDTDILNIHFAVMELLAEDMDLCLVFKNALTIDIDLKVLKSETGEWMDLPMDARLAIPEKTCIKVSLTSPDPLPQIRPPAFPVPAQRPMGGIGRDPRRKPAPDPSILNKRDPRRKNLEVVRSAPVPTEVVKSAPAPLEVLRSAPVPPEVVKSAPEPVPPHEATDLYRPSLNRRDPRKRNFMEPASQPSATQLQPSAGRHPPLILPLQPQQPSLPPLQKPAVEQSKGLSSKDPRLKRFQPPSVARVPEEDEMMNIIKNPSRLSVPVKLPVETSAPRAAAPPLFKPVLVEADTVSLSQILADTDTSTNANNSSVELTSPISQPSFSSMLEVKQDLASITQDLSTGSSTKAVRSPSAAGGSERPLIVVVEPTGGPALTSPGVVSPRPPARSPRDRRISLETGKPEDSDSEGELHIDMGSLEVRRKLSGDSLESPSPSQPSSQGKPSLFLQVPGVQPVTPTTPSRPPVLVSSPSTGELLLPSGGAPALNVIPPPLLIPSISVAEEGPGDHGDVSPTRCSQEKAERTEELWDEIYGEFQKNKSLELHDRESTGSSSPSPPPSSPTKRKILAQEGSLPPSSTQRDPSSSSATPSSSPEPTEIEELKKEVEQSKKTLVQLQKEKEMLINLEKERDRLNSIVEDSAGIQPPEREMEEGTR